MPPCYTLTNALQHRLCRALNVPSLKASWFTGLPDTLTRVYVTLLGASSRFIPAGTFDELSNLPNFQTLCVGSRHTSVVAAWGECN